MKRFLLALFSFAAFLTAGAQQPRVLWFNEIVPDPTSPNNEYIEFFNTSTSPVPLDCYVVVSYFNDNGQQGVYVYNFPQNATIPGLGFYLISSGGKATNPKSAVNFKGGSYTPNDPTTFSNWNDIGTGGSIAKYVWTPPVGQTPGSWSAAQSPIVPPATSFTNFMNMANGYDAALLLFQIKPDGTTTVVNGLFLNQNNNTIPSFISALTTPLSIPPGSTCASGATSVSLGFTGIGTNNVDVFQVQSAAGNNNGDAKIGNGVCGNWVKIQKGSPANQSEFSPGTTNPSYLGTITPNLNTLENLVCNSSQIKFNITGTNPANQTNLLPATVSVFYDNGTTSGTLDVSDTPIPSLTTTVSSTDLNKWFTLTIPTPTPTPMPSILLVYQTAQGCYSKVVTLTATATGQLNTTQTNICGNLIDFSVPSTTNASPAYVLPVTAQLFVDANGNSAMDAGEEITGASKIITSYTTSNQTIPIPTVNKNQIISVSYTSATACYSKTALASLGAGTLTTTQNSYCGQQVDVTFTGASGNAATYALPVKLQVYYDNGVIGTYEPGIDVPAGTERNITTFSTTVNSFTGLDATKLKLVVFTSGNECFSKTVQPTLLTGGLTTTQTSYCNKDIKFQITGGTGDAAAASNAASLLLPVTVEVHYDANNNGVVDADEPVQGTPVQVTSFSTTTYSLTVPDPTQNVLLLYKAPYTCYGKTIAATAATGGITTTQNSFCNKRVEFQVTAGTGAAAANAATYLLPVTAEMHYDLNNNGLVDANEGVVASQNITSFSSTTYTLIVPDPSKKVLMQYQTSYTCYGNTAVPTPTDDAVKIKLGGNINESTKTVTYFIVNAQSSAFPMVLNVYEDKRGNGNIDPEDNIIGTQTAPQVNQNYTATMSNVRSYAIVTANSTTGCSTAFEAIAGSQAPLPVKFKSFTATRKTEKVALKWETATEQNNKGFYVQRSINGGEWKDIAFVFSQAENGNSSSDLAYSFSDLNPAKGVTQYRILQVDIDGKGHYSETRAVHGSEAAGKLLLFPNPSSTGSVTLVFDGDGVKTVSVSDISGRAVKQYRNISGSSLEVKNLTAGFYTVQVSDSTTGTITVEKFIIKKR